MTDQTTGVLDRYGRFLWGGAALLLLLVLLASVVLPGSSDGGSEADAQARAESLSGSFVEKELSADLLARDITGAASRHLTVLVQAVIRSDDRFTTVRIWRLDGALIYSTAQGDDTSVIAADDRWIGQALDGQTVSVLSSAGTYHDGLQRPDEELFQTFVPITLSDDGTVDGVVQIDQRSSSIHGQVGGIWRPLQLVVFLLLIGVGVMFVRWQRRAPASLEQNPNAGSGTVVAPRIRTSWLEPTGPSARRARPKGVCASWRRPSRPRRPSRRSRSSTSSSAPRRPSARSSSPPSSDSRRPCPSETRTSRSRGTAPARAPTRSGSTS